MSQDDKSRAQTTEKKAGIYLFETKPFSESKALNMRTRIRSEAGLNMLLFYSVIGEILDCTNATKIKDAIELMLVSYQGKGREEAVEVLRMNIPQKVKMLSYNVEDNLPSRDEE